MQRVEESNSWSQVINESANKQKGIVEKHQNANNGRVR